MASLLAQTRGQLLVEGVGIGSGALVMTSDTQLAGVDTTWLYEPPLGATSTCRHCDTAIVADEAWGWMHTDGIWQRREGVRGTLVCPGALPTDVPAGGRDWSTAG